MNIDFSYLARYFAREEKELSFVSSGTQLLDKRQVESIFITHHLLLPVLHSLLLPPFIFIALIS